MKTLAFWESKLAGLKKDASEVTRRISRLKTDLAGLDVRIGRLKRGAHRRGLQVKRAEVRSALASFQRDAAKIAKRGSHCEARIEACRNRTAYYWLLHPTV